MPKTGTLYTRLPDAVLEVMRKSAAANGRTLAQEVARRVAFSPDPGAVQHGRELLYMLAGWFTARGDSTMAATLQAAAKRLSS